MKSAYFGMALCTLLVLLPSDARTIAAADGPNVIVILTDDQGFGDIGVHGNQHIATPHLDRFARRGVELTRFYCSPVCAPTRASLMTGRYYYRTGVIHTSRGGAKMHGDEVTLAELFRDNGYATGIFGKWHLGDNYPMRPRDQGFDEVLVHKSGGIDQTPDKPNSYFDPRLWHNGQRVEAEGYCTDVFFSAAMDFVEEHRGDRFFVYLPTNAPHTPLEVAKQYSQPFLDAGLNEATAKVYGMVANIDENVGRLLKHLETLNLRENTLVVFLGDNGPQQARYSAGLRGRKSSTYEGGIRVPCFLQWPAAIEGGRRIDRIAAHIDLLPTLIDACRLQTGQAPKPDGRSLLPLLRDDTSAWPARSLFFQCHRGLSPRRFQNCAVVTQHWKLVGNPGTFSNENLSTEEPPVLELYNLTNDPGEQRNLIDQDTKIADELKAEYEKWFDDVRATRNFKPGVIHLGTSHENPSHLCRYQDATYRDGEPQGWLVNLPGGRYEFTVKRGRDLPAGRLWMRWGNGTSYSPMRQGQKSVFINLWKDENLLQLEFQADGQPRQAITDNSTRGDIVVKRVN